MNCHVGRGGRWRAGERAHATPSLHALAASALLFWAAAAGADVGDISVVCPSEPVAPEATFTAELFIDAGPRVLGSYQAIVLFDPNSAVISSVLGGNASEFASAPEADPATFQSGATALAASNAASTTTPTGMVQVARLELEVRAAAGEIFSVVVQPESIRDAEGVALPAAAGACVVFVDVGEPATATPTRSATPLPTATAPPTPTPPAIPPCIGDCNGDAEVTVDELLLGIAIALGLRPPGDCPAFDPDGDGQVVVTDIVGAVNASLVGCPAVPATPTPISPTATATMAATATATATLTATATPDLPVNLPPVLGPTRIYQAYPGNEILFAVDAIDPDGGTLRYAATDLPEGASFDAQAGLLAWTPAEDQLGPHYIPFVVSDDGQPPASTSGLLYVQVNALSPCLEVTCHPRNGCVANSLPLGQTCCDVAPPPRVAWVDAPCPASGVVFAGRNVNSGIGRLQQCDWLRVMNFAQTGAAVRLNFEARCLSRQAGVRLRVRLQAPSRVVVDDDIDVTFFQGDNGFIERVTVPFNVRGGGPFFDLEDAEALLSVIATDGFGNTQRSETRVRLNFDPHPELADPFVPAPTPAVP